MGARRWLGLGRIVQTEPGYQAELRFLQFPGTAVGAPKSMHEKPAACYGHRLSFTEGKTDKSPASVTASWTALLEKRDGS